MPKIDLFKQSREFQPFAAGQVIFKEGDPGDLMYVVQDGEIDLLLGDRVIETLDAGDIFGEMAILDGKPRSASARAKTDCRVVPINQKRFTMMLQNTPYFAVQVMQVMVDRLRRMDAMQSA